MRSITFSLRPAVKPQQRATLLARLEQLPGVKQTAALRPTSKNEAVQRMCFAQVADDFDIQSIRDQIAALPEVESADIPADRHLS